MYILKYLVREAANKSLKETYHDLHPTDCCLVEISDQTGAACPRRLCLLALDHRFVLTFLTQVVENLWKVE